MLKLVRTDNDELYINDGEIILARWIIDSHHEKVIIRDAYGGLIVESKIPIETDQGERTEASDVISDIGSNWRTRGFSNYYQWVSLGRSSEIISKNNFWYLSNYGTEGSDVDLQIKNTQIAKFDGVGVYIPVNDYTFEVGHTIELHANFNLFASSKYMFGNSIALGIRYNGSNFLVYTGGVINTVNWVKQDKIVKFSCTRRIADEYDIYIDDSFIGTSTTNGADLVVQYIGCTNLANFAPMNTSCVYLEGFLHYYFQEGQGTTIFDQSGNGNHGTVVGATLSDFWSETSEYAYPALLAKGGEIYEDDAFPGDQTKYLYVIKSETGFITPTISGYTKIGEYEPNKGLWNTGNTYCQPSGDYGLFALSKAYTELDFQYGVTANDPLEFDWYTLKAIDVTVDPIPKEDFTINNETEYIKDMASAPYEPQPLRDVNGEILYDINGERLYPLKEF